MGEIALAKKEAAPRGRGLMRDRRGAMFISRNVEVSYGVLKPKRVWGKSGGYIASPGMVGRHDCVLVQVASAVRSGVLFGTSGAF